MRCIAEGSKQPATSSLSNALLMKASDSFKIQVIGCDEKINAITAKKNTMGRGRHQYKTSRHVLSNVNIELSEHFSCKIFFLSAAGLT